jgi:hypothetical protein
VRAVWHDADVKHPAKKASRPKKAAPAAQKKSRPAQKAAAKKPAPRADFGAPIDGFFARQPTPLRAILDEVRKLVDEAAPDAESSIKWGVPFYTVNGAMMCALGAHKSHVNLMLAGPPGTYADPEGRLSGEGKTGRHLKIASIGELPREAVRGWLRTAAEIARKEA